MMYVRPKRAKLLCPNMPIPRPRATKNHAFLPDWSVRVVIMTKSGPGLITASKCAPTMRRNSDIKTCKNFLSQYYARTLKINHASLCKISSHRSIYSSIYLIQLLKKNSLNSKKNSKIFPSQTLIGGHYQLRYIHLLNDEGATKEFEVLVHRSDIEKIDKQSRKSVVWSESEITTIFIVKKIGGVWELSDTR